MDLPSWGQMHPLIVHFPIALLTVAPFLVVISVFFTKYWKPFAVAAFLMVLVGVMGAYSAVSSGEEATLLPAFSEQASAVDASQGNVYEVLMEHSSNAKLASHAFAVIMVLLLVVILASGKLGLEKNHTRLRLVLAAWLVLAMGAMVLLGIAGHGGARLVHEFGINAAL